MSAVITGYMYNVRMYLQYSYRENAELKQKLELLSSPLQVYTCIVSKQEHCFLCTLALASEK